MIGSKNSFLICPRKGPLNKESHILGKYSCLVSLLQLHNLILFSIISRGRNLLSRISTLFKNWLLMFFLFCSLV